MRTPRLLAYKTYKSPCPHSYYLQAGNSQSGYSYLLTDSHSAVAVDQGRSAWSATAAWAQSPRTEMLAAWVGTGCLDSTLSSNKHCLCLWQKGRGKGTGGMSGLTSPLGCHIDYNDLHLLFSTVLPSGFQQYQCCSATLHTIQLGREITLLYTNHQNHLFFSLRLAGDRNFSFFKFLCI